MKQLYKVPFERNSEPIKELRRQYVQRVMELDAKEVPHLMIYFDVAGFNLATRRWCGRNVIGKRATAWPQCQAKEEPTLPCAPPWQCPAWMQWMLHAKTSQLNTARGG